MAAFSMLHATKFESEDFVVDISFPPENVLLDNMHIDVILKLQCHPPNSIKLF
jgi:hypothetical protein